ncbi:MAG: shikimate kinase [Fimbriimonadaceae bacterium]
MSLPPNPSPCQPEPCSWVLVGMMGSGKSTIGQLIAQQTGRRYVDTDRVVESRVGRSVASIFSVYGEAAFRDHETSVLAALSPGADVVSTGGGAVLRESNWSEIRRLGVSLYLHADLDILRERLGRSRRKRPLLANDDWEDRLAEILEGRLPLYRKADAVLEVGDRSMEEVARRAIDLFRSLEQERPVR